MKKYYIGLDIGTDSTGWAATDESYNFLRLKGKTAFGSRLYSKANDCKKRRTFRSNRRRMQRRKYRIHLLNDLFAEELNKIDKNFLIRLENSTFNFEDKKDKTSVRTLLFKTFEEEKNYFKNYPTIFHLRKKLLEDDSTSFNDLRNLYLAIHHIIKYRGNFLKEGKLDYSDFNNELLIRLNEILKTIYLEENEEDFDGDFINSNDKENFKTILLNKNLNKTTKKKELKKLFNVSSELCLAYIDLFVSLITGSSYSLKNLKLESDNKISFEENFDEKVLEFEQLLQDKFEIVQIAKEIYDYVSLNDLLKDEKCLSNVMVNVYDEHKKDLALLKKVIINIDKQKNNDHNLYNEIFKDTNNKNNYSSLVKVNTITDKKTSINDFNKELLKIIKENKDFICEEDYNYLINKLENNELLKTIANVSTSVIPHQLHLNELEIILNNAIKYYPFIATIKDKIIAIFKFRVPYYYGPLDDRSNFSNVVRFNNNQVYPWNINEVIDDNQTRQKFMRRLTNNCRYLFDCKVMPKSSLLYEKFLILDRLNAMEVNGSLLSYKEKEEVFRYIISRNKTTISNLKSYLKKIYNLNDDITINKISLEVPFEAPSHALLNQFFDLETENEKVENLIFLATVYADDKNILKTILEKDISLDKKQINAILSLSTKKWAPFSKELLSGIYYIDDLGVASSIIDIMEKETKNFQVVLNDSKYNFQTIIHDFNKEKRGELTNKEVIDDLLANTPAMFRRSINQTLLILDDIVSITHQDPEKIFIEVTREDLKEDKKKQYDKRQDELKKFLTSLKNDVDSLMKSQSKKLLEELNDENIINKLKIKSKHVYLYFKQMGIDVYTGKIIDLSDVLNSNKYDTDHIIPQSKIKDDSLDNLVLVERTYNQRIKSDAYPIPEEIKTPEILKLWKYLFKIKAISEKKYNNLIRNKELTLQEMEDFVARQINVVNYSNVVLRDVLNIKYPNTKIVFSKAQYASYLRKELKIAKNRNLNDTHHAVDSYLNIVAGNILSTTFSNVRTRYIERNIEEKTFNMERVLNYNLKKNDLANIVKNNCLRHDALVTLKLEYNNSNLYKQTIYKANSSNSLIPIHTNNCMKNTDKYGGYLSFTTHSLAAISYKIKGKEIKKIEALKLMNLKMYKNNFDELVKSLVTEKDATDIKLIKFIGLNQKIQVDNGIYYLYSSEKNQNAHKMAYQNYIDNDLLLYFNFAFKKIDQLSEDNTILQQEIITNKYEEHNFIITKEKNKMIFDSLINNSFNKVYDSCNYIVKLRNLKDDNSFNDFSLKKQIEVINQLIIYMSRNSDSSTLKNYFSNLSDGRLRPTKNITKKKIYLIHESPTGLYKYKKLL